MNSLPKTVTRQHRGCDLNPGPSAPESSTLTTHLPSHHMYWEPSLDCRQDGSVEQIYSRGELAEQPVTLALVNCHEKVTLLSYKFCQCFCLMTSSNLNVSSA